MIDLDVTRKFLVGHGTERDRKNIAPLISGLFTCEWIRCTIFEEILEIIWWFYSWIKIRNIKRIKYESIKSFPLARFFFLFSSAETRKKGLYCLKLISKTTFLFWFFESATELFYIFFVLVLYVCLYFFIAAC
jgi:hypothetical protein